MKKLTVATIALLIMSASAAAQESRKASGGTSDEQAVVAASRRNSADELSEVLVDDDYYISRRGQVMDKRAQVAALRNGATHFDARSTSDERVRMFKAVAVVTLLRH